VGNISLAAPLYSWSPNEWHLKNRVAAMTPRRLSLNHWPLDYPVFRHWIILSMSTIVVSSTVCHGYTWKGVNMAKRSGTVVARVYPSLDPAMVARPYVLL
jgi:hypothetical protein